MELRQLEYFQVVSRLNSMSKAAEELRIAQPSVSIAIQKLEEELGVSLFDRSRRQIILTPEGIIFSQRANDILSRIDDSVSEMQDLRSLQTGSIKIGIPPMIGVFLFPHIFAGFRKQYPHIKLTAGEGGSLAIENLLEQGRLDIGIITRSNSSSVLETVPITTGQIHVCMHSNHPLNKLSSIPFSSLSDQPFILLKEDTYNRQAIMAECKKYHFTPQIIFSSSQIETIISLVELEIGISFLFESIAQRYSTIRSSPLSDPIHSHIVLAWNRDKYLSKASRAFINFITDMYQIRCP
ncbi:MAG: cynR 5 [Anaerosporomusa subterranea]|jgi:DNA-binding transcriptional LysR family regulator|nr:cynR 5 [Anaerosporomusa subterranea]